MKIRSTDQDFQIAPVRISNRKILIDVFIEGMDSNQDTVLRYLFDILRMQKNLKVIIINIHFILLLSLYEKRIRPII